MAAIYHHIQSQPKLSDRSPYFTSAKIQFWHAIRFAEPLQLQDSRNHPELDNLQIQNRKLVAETRKLLAEEKKLRREAFWYPFLVGADLITAAGAIINLLSRS